jgi:tRNA C32,U32 (ribose-2'-O)-methylase TrmJ
VKHGNRHYYSKKHEHHYQFASAAAGPEGRRQKIRDQKVFKGGWLKDAAKRDAENALLFGREDAGSRAVQ